MDRRPKLRAKTRKFLDAKLRPQINDDFLNVAQK